jgi:hypothetical protein
MIPISFGVERMANSLWALKFYFLYLESPYLTYGLPFLDIFRVKRAKVKNTGG